MTVALQVRDLVLGYDRTDAVKGISFDVEDRSVVALIGSNGAGKSTTLRGLSGLVRPRAGSMSFKGREISGWAAHRIAQLGIVHVPEGRQIFATMTIAENLAIGAYLEPDKAVVRDRLERVLLLFPRLKQRFNQSAGLLSGGEQQMLAIGRALMADIKLLLLDEPSMGLAPLIVEEIFQTVELLKREGCTILLVEQNVTFALQSADYVYVLESGRIKIHGLASQIANNPDIASAYLGH